MYSSEPNQNAFIINQSKERMLQSLSLALNCEKNEHLGIRYGFFSVEQHRTGWNYTTLR